MFHFRGHPLPGTASLHLCQGEHLECQQSDLSLTEDEPYEASIADTEDLERALEDIEEFFPGELAPGPPAAMTPDYVEGSEAEVEAPDEVDGRLQLPGVKLHFAKRPGLSVT